MADDDWDLHAVVRGRTAASSSSTTTACSRSSGDCQPDHLGTSGGACFEDLLLLEPKREATSRQDDLHDLYRPFFFPSARPSSEMTILPSQSFPSSTHDKIQQQQQQQPFSVVNLQKPTTATPKSSSRPKKRKNCMKRVRHVAAEEVSGDVWSWRKYGQKPIKGSPYPRGYYRCSTSKGCMARKQVERNRSDPGMFILTYTGEHNHPMPTHRTSLSSPGGASRHKLPEDVKPLPETKSDACRSEPDNDQVANDDDDNFSPLEDDFFEGLEGFTGGECTMDDSLVELPWLADDGTSKGGGGGG